MKDESKKKTTAKTKEQIVETEMVITSLQHLEESVDVRVEKVAVPNVGYFYVRELDGGTVSELMRRSPQIIERGSDRVTDNSTNRLDMAFVVSNAVCVDSDGTKLLFAGRQGEKTWSKYPVRILRPLFQAALKLSDLVDEEEGDGEEGNDENDS